MTKEKLKKIAIKAIDDHRDEIYAMGDSIFTEPELGYKEYKTSEKVVDLFKQLGFNYRTEVAITGVIADLKGKESKAKIAVMGELDAVIASSHPQADQTTGAAHACGHNCMIAALAGVAYALGTTEIMKHLSGDVSLMAVPAEEFVEIEYRKGLIDEGKINFIGGKQEFIYLGEFDDIDVALMEHNGIAMDGVVACGGYGSNGFLGKMIQYQGRAAHAGAAPHLGINALNAANIGLSAVNYQRETFLDEDSIRIHPIITKGGELVNTVPDDVRIETYIRGANVNAILDANKKVDRAFQAGAYAVGATCNIIDLPGYLPLIMCDPLMEIMVENQQEILGADKVAYAGPPMGGSTDAGDLSNIVPTLHCGFGGVAGDLHSGEFTITDKEIAYVAAAKGLVMTLIDLLWDGAAKTIEVKERFTPNLTKEEYLKDWGSMGRKGVES